ncbi:MAG: hypothetical protein AAF663_01800 [Planctomycetota bacterium]
MFRLNGGVLDIDLAVPSSSFAPLIEWFSGTYRYQGSSAFSVGSASTGLGADSILELGADKSLEVTNALVVAGSGRQLNLDGGVVETGDKLDIAGGASVLANGGSSRARVGTSLNVGGTDQQSSGTGELVIRNNADVIADEITNVWDGGVITLASDNPNGSLDTPLLEVSSGTVDNLGGFITLDDGGAMNNNSQGLITVGERNNGTLNISSGGQVTTASDTEIGNRSGATGQVTVSGASSLLDIGDDLHFGSNGGDGTMTISDFGRVNVADTVTIGRLAGSTSTLRVESGGVLAAENSVILPRDHDGNNGGGGLTVTGANSQLLIGQTSGIGDLVVGGDGSGEFELSAGASASVAEVVYVGKSATGSGEATITGAGTSIFATNGYIVGEFGTGLMEIAGGASVTTTSGAIVLGYRSASARGNLTIGDDSTLSTGAAADLIVGDQGVGGLTINDTAVVSAGDDIIVGNQGTGVGVITLNGGVLESGLNSTSGDVVIGAAGGGTFVQNGGTLRAGRDLINGRSSAADNGVAFIFGGEASVARNLVLGAQVGAVGVLRVASSSVNASQIAIGFDPSASTSGNVGVGSLLIASGVVVTDQLTLGESSSVALNGGVLKANSVSGLSEPLDDESFEFNGGDLQVGDFLGDLDQRGGSISPEAMTISGDLNQSAGTIDFEIAGLARNTEYDTVTVLGMATLAGGVTVSLTEGYTPAVDDSFDILTATDGITGAFSVEQLPELNNGLFFDIVYGADVVQLVVAGVEGDYNRDGMVNAADYTVWRDNLGATYTAEDYLVWRANFGASAEQSANNPGSLAPESARVPEPIAAILISVGAVAALPFSRRRRCVTTRSTNVRTHAA